MKKLVLILMFVAGLVVYADAQQDKYVFDDRSLDLDTKGEEISSHYLGQEVAVKMHLLNKKYTYLSEPSPTSPVPKTYVDKPTIYYGIMKLNALYKKQLKQGMINEQQAKYLMNKYLDLALIIRYQQTAEFEKELGTAKKEQIAVVFDKIELK